jgi:hypothetical protein
VTLHAAMTELAKAIRALGDEFAKPLRLQQINDWLERQIKKRPRLKALLDKIPPVS